MWLLFLCKRLCLSHAFGVVTLLGGSGGLDGLVDPTSVNRRKILVVVDYSAHSCALELIFGLVFQSK